MGSGDDFSIEALTAQLQEVQKKKSSVRLSERNIVELISKLKELKFLSPDLLYTANGREFITAQRFRDEVEDEINKSGGRLSISSLCDLLNVDINHCENQIKKVIAKSKEKIFEWQGDIITSEYTSAICDNINDYLKQAGMANIGDLANQYYLSTEMIKNILKSGIGYKKGVKIMGNIIYTETYRNRLKAQLKGSLRACLIPYAISKLLVKLDINENTIIDMINSIIKELIKLGEIKGELKDNGEFVPAIYVTSQMDLLISSFTQNGWLPLSSLWSLGVKSDIISKKKDFMESIKLDTVIISSALISLLNSEIIEAKRIGTWCDLSMLIPVAFNKRDIDKLLAQCNLKENREGMVIMTETCIVTEEFIQKCHAFISEEVVELADVAFAKYKERKLKEKGLKAVEQKLESKAEDDWEGGRGGGTKGKGKKKTKTKMTNTSGEGRGFVNSSSEMRIPDLLISDIFKIIEKCSPEIIDVNGLSQALAESFHTFANEKFRSSLEKLISMGSEERQQYLELSLKSLEDCYREFETCIKALDIFKEDTNTRDIIKKQAIKTKGSEIFDWMLRHFQFQDHGFDFLSLDKNNLVPIPATERADIISSLPKQLAKSTIAFQNSLRQDNINEVLIAIEDSVDCCGIRFKKLDKKIEKMINQKYIEALKDRLRIENNYPDALSLALPIIISNVYGHVLSIPGKAIPGAMQLLRNHLNEEDFGKIETFHRLVVEYLKSQSGHDAGVSQENSTLLKGLLPDIKRIAMVIN